MSISNIIEITRGGFLLTAFSQKQLSYVGGLFLLRASGYINHLAIRNCINQSPYNIQSCVRSVLEEYKDKILRSGYINTVKSIDGHIELFLIKNNLSVHRESTLHINVDSQHNNFFQLKKILYTVYDMAARI